MRNFLTHRLFFSIFILITALFICVKPTFAQEKRIVKVGVYHNPPKISVISDGQVSGLFADVLIYIAEKENWELVFVPGTFEQNLQQLESGEIDIAVDVAVTGDRELLFDFSNETILSSWGVVYTNKNMTLDSFKDLSGKDVAILRSSVYMEGPAGINQYIGAFELDIRFVEKEQYDEVFTLLENGEVDAAIVSRISGLEAEKKYKNIKASDVIFSPTELRFAFTRNAVNSSYLREKIDTWIRIMKNDQEKTFEGMLRKYGLSSLVTRIEVVPPWVLPTIIGGILFILISWILILSLRTARRTALGKLAEKERYFSKVIDNVPVILSEIDTNGIVLFAAGKSVRDVIDDPNKLTGSSIFELYKDNQEITKNIRLAIQGQEVKYEASIGSHIFRMIATPIKRDTLVEKVVVLAIDITEEHQLQKAKKEFIALVQHQLRTPPGAMRWAVELLSPKVTKILTTQEREIWNIFESQIKRMITLANTLSDVSEIETGLFPINPEEFSLPELIETISKEFINKIEVKKLSVLKKYSEPKTLKHDKNAVGIILHALISNAVQYSEQGGKITITASDQPNSVIVSVSDSAKKIPDEVQGKLFTNLYRGKEAIKMNPEGLGLSLYLTKLLLEQLKGKIWYEPNPTVGNTFHVEIPKSFSS